MFSFARVSLPMIDPQKVKRQQERQQQPGHAGTGLASQLGPSVLLWNSSDVTEHSFRQGYSGTMIEQDKIKCPPSS